MKNLSSEPSRGRGLNNNIILRIPSPASFYISSTLLFYRMMVNECPKKLRHCPKNGWPMYPCWAYEKHLDDKDHTTKLNDEGWE